jgi:hypothetical protein
MNDNILTTEEIEDMTTDERLENIKRLENGAITLMIEEIRIPIYFTQDEDKEVWIDEERIYEELKEKLRQIQEKPENFLEIEE